MPLTLGQHQRSALSITGRLPAGASVSWLLLNPALVGDMPMIQGAAERATQEKRATGSR